MLLTLFLSGYIPPSSGAINFMLGVLALAVVAGLLVLWWGVRVMRQEREYAKVLGVLLILIAVALPVLGFNWLASIF